MSTMAPRPDQVLERELALVALGAGWARLDRVAWTRLVDLAVTADDMVELLATPGVLTRSNLGLLHRVLLDIADPSTRQWAGLMQAARVVGSARPARAVWPRDATGERADQPLRRLWLAAAGAGWPPAEVNRLSAAARTAQPDTTISPEPGKARWDLTWLAGLRLRPHRLHPVGHGSAPATAICVVPRPDGRTWLAVSEQGNRIRLIDAGTGEPAGAGETELAKGGVFCTFRPADGRVLLAVGERHVRFWDPVTGDEERIPIRGIAGSVTAVCEVRSGDGRVLLAAGTRTGKLGVVDPAGDRPAAQILAASSDPVVALCPVRLPDRPNLLACAHSDGTVRLWDLTDATARFDLVDAVGQAIVGLCPLRQPDGWDVLAWATSDGTVWLADLEGSRILVSARDQLGGGTPRLGEYAIAAGARISALCPVPVADGTTLLAVAAADGPVRLYDPATGGLVDVLAAAGSDHVRAVGVVPGSSLLVTVGDGDVRLWETGGVGLPVLGPVRTICPVSLADGRSALVTDGDGMLRTWDAATGEAIGGPWTGQDTLAWLHDAVPMPDGRTLIAVSCDGQVQLWNPATGQPATPPLTEPFPDGAAVVPLRMPDGRVLLATSPPWPPRLWDASTGEPAEPVLSRRSGPRTPRLQALGPLPDSRVMVAGMGLGGVAELWDVAAGCQTGEVTGRPTRLCLIPAPDDRIRLAIGYTNGSVQFADPVTGAVEGEPVAGHSGHVTAACTVGLPDGRVLLATGGEDWTVRLWEPGSGRTVGSLPTLGRVHALAAVPDGGLAVGAGHHLSVMRPASLV